MASTPLAARLGATARAFTANHLRRAGPLALLAAVSAAAATVLGAHVYNAWPFQSLPYGRPGPAGLEQAVSYARPALSIAMSLPAVLLGVRTARRLDPTRHSWRQPLQRAGADYLLLAVAAVTAGLLAALLTGASPADAVVGFIVAHALLAWSFHAIGFTAAVCLGRAGPLAAAATWLALHTLYESLVRWRLFRASGYYELRAGDFPDWFYASQAGSPLALYRGTLILWRPGFRDALEQATLGGAALPAWLSATTMAGLMLVIWVLAPLAVAALVWRARLRRAAALASLPEPQLHLAWQGDDPAWDAAWANRGAPRESATLSDPQRGR